MSTCLLHGHTPTAVGLRQGGGLCAKPPFRGYTIALSEKEELLFSPSKFLVNGLRELGDATLQYGSKSLSVCLYPLKI
jgi:hypothetical protein